MSPLMLAEIFAVVALDMESGGRSRIDGRLGHPDETRSDRVERGQWLARVNAAVHGHAVAGLLLGGPFEHPTNNRQASHADLAPALALVLPVLPLFAAWVPCPVGPVLPRQGAPFEARGPPPRR